MASKWDKLRKDKGGGETTPHLTMNLRQVVTAENKVIIEQMIEYKNEKGMVVSTDWVAIPIIYEN